MSALLQLYLDQFLLFVLVLTRISGLVMTAPIYGSRSVPIRIRALIAVALGLMITPTQDGAAMPVPEHLVGVLMLLSRELLLGVSLGLAVMILFSGVQLAGQIVGQISGMSLADVFDPTFQANVSVFSQLLDVITMLVFLTVGGHRYLLKALLDTFRWQPPGYGELPREFMEVLTDVMSESFLVGIRAAAPVMVSVMLAVLILGLISRTLPQLNILAVGFSLNATIMLAVFSFSLAGVAWVVQERSEAIVDAVSEVLRVES